MKADIERHQLDQFLREGKLDEEDESAETPEVVGEDTISPRKSNFLNFFRDFQESEDLSLLIYSLHEFQESMSHSEEDASKILRFSKIPKTGRYLEWFI